MKNRSLPILTTLATCQAFVMSPPSSLLSSVSFRKTSLVTTPQKRWIMTSELFSTLDEEIETKDKIDKLKKDSVMKDEPTKIVNDDLKDHENYIHKVMGGDDRIEILLQQQNEFFDHEQISINDDNMIDNPKDYLIEARDPFMKWVQADISDPIMQIVSSEIGVRNFVQTIAKPGNDIPNSSHIPFDLLVSRGVDTVEDIALHLARIPYSNGRTDDLDSDNKMDQKRKTVVILGSGWAAHAFIKVADSSKLRMIVVSPANHFVFTPMLASSAVGTVEYRSMTEAVRAANPMIDDYLEGKATAVDVHKKKVTVELKSLLDGVREGTPPTIELDYDHLLVSVGSQIDFKGVPGAEKALRLKTTDDAVNLRRAIGECLEFASRPDVSGPDKTTERRNRATFLIVGGGPTGVELAGELLDLACDITRPDKGTYPKLKGDIQVVLAHSGPDLVPQFEPRLRQEALKSLEKKGAKVFLNTRVNEVGDGFATLSTKKVDTVTGEVTGREEFQLPTGITVWCAGTTSVDFVSELLEQLPEEVRNHDGRVKVDKWLRPQMPTQELMGSVLVLGDAAAFPEGDETIATDRLLPQTAQVAGQQGAYAARMLTRGYNLSATPVPMLDENLEDLEPLMVQWLTMRGITRAPPFQFLNLGLLAYLGGNEALTQVQIGNFPLFSYFGSIAFVLWRSVYLVKQVATRNRVLVTFDWIKSSIFGRDMTRF